MNTEAPNGVAVAGPEAARSAAPALDGLPCQNNNNSTKSLREFYKFKRKIEHDADTQFFEDRDGRFWERDPAHHDTEKLLRIGDLNNAEAKAAFILRGQVTDFFNYWGREHCAFFTLTDSACRHPTDYNHCFDSWKTHHGGWMKGYIRVLQPQRRGAPHYHILAAVSWDSQIRGAMRAAGHCTWQFTLESESEYGEREKNLKKFPPYLLQHLMFLDSTLKKLLPNDFMYALTFDERASTLAIAYLDGWASFQFMEIVFRTTNKQSNLEYIRLNIGKFIKGAKTEDYDP